MKLYYTPNSPYARIARVAALESGLANRVEFIQAKTRDPETDFFEITPLARVPALTDNGVLIADTRDICAHFDRVTGTPVWLPPETPATRTLRHVAVGFLDGVAVWLRENARCHGEKSAAVMRYEEHRARHALLWLDRNAHPPEPLDFTSLCLVCAIDIGLKRGMGADWGKLAPGLIGWATTTAQRPSMRATAPGPP